MKKRLISLLLVFCMLFSLLPASALAAQTEQTAAQSSQSSTAQQTQTQNTNPFRDVKQTDWFYAAVQYAVANGFFSGTAEKEFSPNGGMTRGMFVTVLGKMAGVKAADWSAAHIAFADVSADAYYAPFVAWAAEYGITGGTGAGTFSPDQKITRQQMAVFFVKYFEAMNVNYATGANITTQPGDLDQVADWARDAVLKLWKQGLLSGDGVNFNPGGEASRAQAAALCRSADKAVDTWFSAPGVKSERVPADPETQPAAPDKQPEDSKPGSSGGGGGGSSRTTYYEVKFALGDGQSSDGVTLPAAATYAAGTAMNLLPTPTSSAGGIFLGWYYDKALEKPVAAGDTLTGNLTLYAQMAAGDQIQPMETPNYITKTDVPVGAYTFRVIGVSNVGSALTIIDVTGGNSKVNYTVSGDTVSDDTVTVTLEANGTYQAELTDDKAQFVVDGETQDVSVRYLNLLTRNEEVKNASLNQNMVKGDVSKAQGLDESVFNGLYQTDGTAAQANDTAGSFTSTQQFLPGQTVYFARKGADLNDVTSTAGDVAYVKIIASAPADGGYTRYTYEMADVDDVLFMPDVLPIASSEDTDGNPNNNSITVTPEVVAEAMKKVSAASLDKGDLIAFDAQGETAQSYAKIIDFRLDGGYYVIDYEPVTDVDSAMDDALDVYYTEEKPIELSQAEKDTVTQGIVQNIQDSGYMEQAGLYIAAMMTAEDGAALPDETVLSEQIAQARADGQPVSLVMGDRKVQASVNWSAVQVSFRTNLQKLRGSGLGVVVSVPMEIALGDGVTISLKATFEEEAQLHNSISTKRHKIGFLKYDYSLNTSFNVGNYTGISFTANIATGSEDESKDSLGQRLEQVMDIIEGQGDRDSVSSIGGVEELAEVYQDLMESAGDSWYDVVEQKLFETNGSAFLHIFCWQIKGSFVVSVNLNASMGMTFEYITQKQYNYSVRVKARTTTNQTIDLIPSRYQFDFYVVGTVGVRAGLRLEMYVGLFSLKLDKIGISADVGAYVQLWGYFYYHKEWTQNATVTRSGGAMLIEIGVYLEIHFVAQAFSSSKLTYAPTLYNNQWPLWSAGARQNVYAFAEGDDAQYDVKGVKTLTLPAATFRMKTMDLRSGELGTQEGDDASESGFVISLSNPAFTYNPANNTVTVAPQNGSLDETATMTISWKKAPMTFSSEAIRKTVTIHWSDPEGMRYIAFDSDGGSVVNTLSGGSGAALTWPADPVKEGYTFAGWYTDANCNRKYTGSTTVMPAFSSGNGMTLYAKWTPAERHYTVEHYFQKLDGTYTAAPQVEVLTGLTGAQTAAKALSETGFTAQPFEQQTIAPVDDSTVVRIYYDRNSYTLTFEPGYNGGEAVQQTYLYGAKIQAPALARTGYNRTGWDKELPTTAAEDATFTARWTAKNYEIAWNNNYSSLNAYGVEYQDTTTTAEGIYDQTLTVAAAPTVPAVTGARCSFLGWNTKADGSGVMLDSKTKETVTGPATYYAQWKVEWNKHTLTWSVDASAGETIPEGDYTHGDVAYGTDIVAPPTPVKARTAEFTYTFEGWYTDADFPQKVESFGKMGDADVTYYARFTAETNQYTITWVNDGTELRRDTLAYGAPITPPDTPTKAADAQYTYAFSGWKDANGAAPAATVTGDVTYAAQYEKTVNSYTVTWNVNGGNELTGDYTHGSVPYGTVIQAPTPTRDTVNGKDYAFINWLDQNGQTLTEGAAVTGDVNYTAQWRDSDQVLTATFETYDNDEPIVNTQNVVYGHAIVRPANDPTRTGYTFLGWYQGETAWDFNTPIQQDITLTAKWKINTYTITWVVNGTETKETLEHGQTPSHDTPANYDDAEGAVYSFERWEPEVTAATKDATYTAVFRKTTLCDISFDGNGSNDDVKNLTEPIVVERGKQLPDIAASNLPRRAGYKFLGYYYGTTLCYNEQGIGQIVWNFAGRSATLSAQWREAKLTYDYNRGKSNDTFTVSGNEAIHAPYYQGYHFVSWNYEPDGTGGKLTNGSVLYDDLTVYAQWTADDANATKYDLWIAGVQVTDNNKDNICADGISTNTGTISYDPATNTLTFADHVEIRYEGTVIQQTGIRELTIKFPDGSGNILHNTQVNSTGTVHGIDVPYVVTISGGTVTIQTSDNPKATYNNAVYIGSSHLRIKGGARLTAIAGSAGKTGTGSDCGSYGIASLSSGNEAGWSVYLIDGTLTSSGNTAATYLYGINGSDGSDGSPKRLDFWDSSSKNNNRGTAYYDTLKGYRTIYTENSSS